MATDSSIQRHELVRTALDPATPRDAEAVARYASANGIEPAECLAHLAGRFASFEIVIERVLALATHTTPDRQAILRDALDTLRKPYERALGEAFELHRERP